MNYVSNYIAIIGWRNIYQCTYTENHVYMSVVKKTTTKNNLAIVEIEQVFLATVDKMVSYYSKYAPMGQHGTYLFWPQLLRLWLSDFLAVFTDDLIKRNSFCPD